MSAVCYIYAREVHKVTGKPIGLVNTNWGGTHVEFWMSSDALNKCNNGTQSPAGGAWNGMVKPLLNMTIYGAIWYQGMTLHLICDSLRTILGEANQLDPWTQAAPPNAHAVPGMWPQYACTFPSMIDGLFRFTRAQLTIVD